MQIEEIKINHFGKLKNKEIKLKKRNQCDLWKK